MRPRKHPDISIERLKELFYYNTASGTITDNRSRRILLPYPETLQVAIYDGETGLRKQVLHRNLAYILGTGEAIPPDKRVLNLDLDERNVAFCNLRLVDKSVYRKIRAALKNLSGGIQIKQHKHDKHAYVVSWLDMRERFQIFYDFPAADHFRSQKMLEEVKFVNQFIRSK